MQTKKVDVPDVYYKDKDDLVEFDDLDENVDTTELVPLWARIANRVVAPFFVLYNRMSKWWHTKSLKKNRYVKRF